MHRILCIRRKLLETCRLRVRFCPAGIGRRLQRGGKQQKRRLAKSLTGHDCRDRHNSIGADYAESVHNSGDTQLKEFAGSLGQFSSPETIADIGATTANVELARLLESENVAKLVSDGYSVTGVFVTNIDRDTNATAYLDGRDDIRLFDGQVLSSRYVAVGPTEPVGTPVTFDVFGLDCAEYQIEDVKVVFAPLKGTELIGLDGIASSELFAWNVRGSLGRTKVNKDIGRSIDDPGEHKNFLLYHNGLTVLCQQLEREGDKITISKYSVVNGCQSLTT